MDRTENIRALISGALSEITRTILVLCKKKMIIVIHEIDFKNFFVLIKI